MINRKQKISGLRVHAVFGEGQSEGAGPAVIDRLRISVKRRRALNST